MNKTPIAAAIISTKANSEKVDGAFAGATMIGPISLHSRESTGRLP
jgi:hypothetical protein